ncbi:MAG: MFS transporter, partial [Massilia sp.]|nr:MFS transporter [Massilia sp.]
MAAPAPAPAGTAAMLRWVLAAHFLASLADNALLAVAISLLESRLAPGWTTPALRISFYAAYVLLAPLAGPLADRFDKARLMTAVNALKLAGCVGLAAGAHPVLVFGSIGLGAAAYAPARYGILPELVKGRALLRANAAMEIVSIVAILAGVALGALMVAGSARWSLYSACALMALLYAGGAAAAAMGGLSPAVRLPRPAQHGTLGFKAGFGVLLRDPDARVSLAITSLFWATAAVLQFMMIDWARRVLGLGLAAASMLPA